MKTVFISILAISFLSFSVNAQPAISQEAKSLEGEVVQHKKDQRNKLAEAYKEYKATKAAAATAYKSANLQSEKDFRKAKELIAQENKDFNKKYKEIKLNLTKKKVDPRKADVKAEAPSEAKPESKPEEPKQEEVKK